MRHSLKTKKLGRPTDQRIAMVYSAVQSLIKNGRMTTTLMRAKTVRKVAEKLITLAKAGDLNARRNAYKILKDRTLVKTLFDMAPRFAERKGGYTRLTKAGIRRGDASPVAVIEFVD